MLDKMVIWSVSENNRVEMAIDRDSILLVARNESVHALTIIAQLTSNPDVSISGIYKVYSDDDFLMNKYS